MAIAIQEAANAAEPLGERSSGEVLNGHHMAPDLDPNLDKDTRIWVRASALVQATPAKVYALWRDIESAGQWQDMILDVISTGPRTSHWVMKCDGETIEWDSEILADEPGRRIAWRSTRGDSDNAGEVVFDAAPCGRGTIVTVLHEFCPGKKAATRTQLGRNPKQAAIEDLRNFKAFAETGGIPRTAGRRAPF